MLALGFRPRSVNLQSDASLHDCRGLQAQQEAKSDTEVGSQTGNYWAPCKKTSGLLQPVTNVRWQTFRRFVDYKTVLFSTHRCKMELFAGYAQPANLPRVTSDRVNAVPASACTTTQGTQLQSVKRLQRCDRPYSTTKHWQLGSAATAYNSNTVQQCSTMALFDS
jgi:hypothetical protein